MAVFDEYIVQVKDYIEKLRGSNVQIRDYECKGSADDIKKKIPVNVGEGANPGIILRGDTFIELGNPLQGSCSIFLWTDDMSKIDDGKITLFGPDIQEAGEDSIPLGQIFLAAGKKFPDLEHNSLVHNQRAAGDIEGYMLKSSLDYTSWGRVSKAAAEKGFSFEILGKAMIALYKTRVPETEAVQIAFITSGKEDVKNLESIASKAKDISREIVREAWKAKGYDLDCDYDCSSCGDKNVCDDLRDVIKKQSDKIDRKLVKRREDSKESA